MAIGWAAAILCAAIAALPAQTAAQDTAAKPKTYAYRYRVLGVFDAASGDPVEGVEVIDVLNGNKALTTKTGTVSLMFLPDGGSLVRLRKVGYEMQTMTVAISPADTTPLTVVLAHATALEPVVVKDSAPKYLSPTLRAFEERMKAGFGHFVTETEFRKDDGKPLANILLSHIPGIMRKLGPRGETFLVSTRQPNCYVNVYQDGVRMTDAVGTGMRSRVATAAVDFSHLDGTSLTAAEFYAGGAAVPPEFNATSNGCGTLLLWTRER